ncbi:MAG: hypothetical protein RIB03_00160 [Henriciella sp.]|uniref:hypothetical protein n=1 Tax=Henriciella sp. TaxID=1968823 RepID=UPI0032EAB5DE
MGEGNVEARSFGQNGAVLDDMKDERLRVELRDRRRFHAWFPAVLFGLMAVAFVANHYFGVFPAQTGLTISLFCFTAAGVLAPALVAHAQYAIENFRLPQGFGERPRHSHVSGGAVLLVAVVLTIVVSVLRLVDGVEGDLVMSGPIGLAVVCVIAGAFIVFILSPRLISSKVVVATGRAFANVTSQRSPLGGPLNFLGRAVSIFDSWLVHIIAPSAGVSLKNGADRYGVLTLYLAMCGLLVWYFPAPFGLIPAALWFLISISVARRWAWIEDDREVTLRRPRYDASELRVGVGEDLRDEALLALLSLILLLPLAMRQIHFGMGGELFSVEDGQIVQDNLWTWLSFFGLELAKAVPFVDWADIYDVDTQFVLNADSMAAHHVVFIARAIIDLVFLSALLQAISISLKLSRHKRMFFTREIDLLDPMIEKIEFEKLAHKVDGTWRVREEVTKFAHYDPVGLARIRARNDKKSAMHAVATAIKKLQHEGVSPASERFLEKACSRMPDVAEVEAAWRAASRRDETPIEFLIGARTNLNNKPSFNNLRAEIVQKLVAKPVSVERNAALRDILMGDNQDSIRDNRGMTIEPLKASAQWDIWNMRALKTAAQSDRSQLVRKAAAEALRDLGPLAMENTSRIVPPLRADTSQRRSIPVLGEID